MRKETDSYPVHHLDFEPSYAGSDPKKLQHKCSKNMPLCPETQVQGGEVGHRKPCHFLLEATLCCRLLHAKQFSKQQSEAARSCAVEQA